MAYGLLDFGNGKKLEQFDNIKVIRPSIYAKSSKPQLDKWEYDLEFILPEVGQGYWIDSKSNHADLTRFPEFFENNFLKYSLEFNNHGNLGVFPEHLNYTWLQNILIAESELEVLNLFSYSGTSILPSLSSKNKFTHVDSSRNAINLLKKNININNIDTSSRFIVEDVITFLEKEVKRGRKYDVIILDPPTFGRGVNSEIFKLTENLKYLLNLFSKLMGSKFKILLFTHHTNEIDNSFLARDIEGSMKLNIEFDNSSIKDSFGKELFSGYILKYVKIP